MWSPNEETIELQVVSDKRAVKEGSWTHLKLVFRLSQVAVWIPGAPSMILVHTGRLNWKNNTTSFVGSVSWMWYPRTALDSTNTWSCSSCPASLQCRDSDEDPQTRTRWRKDRGLIHESEVTGSSVLLAHRRQSTRLILRTKHWLALHWNLLVAFEVLWSKIKICLKFWDVPFLEKSILVE